MTTSAEELMLLLPATPDLQGARESGVFSALLESLPIAGLGLKAARRGAKEASNAQYKEELSRFLVELWGVVRAHEDGLAQLTSDVERLWREVARHGKGRDSFQAALRATPQQALPAAALVSVSNYSCFISYSEADFEFARKLADALTAHEIRCWFSEYALDPGERKLDAIDRGIRLWDKTLVVCSASSLGPGEWWVRDELDKAILKEAQLTKERAQRISLIIPLDLDGYYRSEDYVSGHRSVLESRFPADFREWENETAFQRSLERLVRALRADAGARPQPPSPKL